MSAPYPFALAACALVLGAASLEAQVVACTSNPNVGAPVISQPSNSQVIVFTSGTASPASVLIRWDSLTLGVQPAPNNEWVVEKGPFGKGGSLVNFLNARVVKGLSTTFSFAIPDTHTVRVRPKNCGQTAPSTSVTFSTRY